MGSSRVTLTLSRLSTLPDDYSSTGCPACDGQLAFHQPDTRQPHRLLAICDDCDAWFLIDMVRSQILHLPGDHSPSH
jgi:hypothetical protein